MTQPYYPLQTSRNPIISQARVRAIITVPIHWLTTSLNFSQRASIVATGVNIANAPNPYPPLNPAPVCIDYAGTPPVSIANIQNIRCDGVVEYSTITTGFVYGATRIMLTVNGA